MALVLMLTIAFDALQLLRRHECGPAMLFPRVNRIRRDKPAAEADSLVQLQALIDGDRGRPA